MTNQSKEIAEVKEHVLTLQQNAKDMVITNELEFTQAEQFSKLILSAEKTVTARKELITRPLMDSLASVRDLFKPLESAISDTKAIVKKKRLDWTNKEEARIALEKSRVEARVEKGTMRVDTAMKKVEAIGTAPKSGVRLLPRMRIVDESIIPREYMTPNLPVLTEAVVKQRLTIPGCEFYEEKIIV